MAYPLKSVGKSPRPPLLQSDLPPIMGTLRVMTTTIRACNLRFSAFPWRGIIPYAVAGVEHFSSVTLANHRHIVGPTSAYPWLYPWLSLLRASYPLRGIRLAPTRHVPAW